MTARKGAMVQARPFLEGAREVDFEAPSRAERHRWIVQSLGQLAYERWGQKERGFVMRPVPDHGSIGASTRLTSSRPFRFG